jgi:hypothetical protein
MTGHIRYTRQGNSWYTNNSRSPSNSRDSRNVGNTCSRRVVNNSRSSGKSRDSSHSKELNVHSKKELQQQKGPTAILKKAGI